MAKIEIGGLSFPSKTAAIEHFRAMLNRHLIGARIPDPDNTELGWLLERHPEYQDKARCGVDYFSIRNALYGTRCFEIGVRIPRDAGRRQELAQQGAAAARRRANDIRVIFRHGVSL